MDRLQDLEDLVQDLRGQLGQEQPDTAGDDLSQPDLGQSSPAHLVKQRDSDGSPASVPSVARQKAGRLVLQDPSRDRYVSSGFWTVVNDTR